MQTPLARAFSNTRFVSRDSTAIDISRMVTGLVTVNGNIESSGCQRSETGLVALTARDTKLLASFVKIIEDYVRFETV